MDDLFVAIGLFFVIEGLVYALAPSLIRRVAAELPKLSDDQLRLFGLVFAVIGVLFVWIIRK